jgi:eukaryotic-like serine/threonine-protein kinase
MAVRRVSAPAAVGSPVRESVAPERLLDGRYRIERLLGNGGMAAVWRGRDLRLDRPVAIKELVGEGLRQPMALERFDREARAVGRLSHPNVVSVYDVGTQDGRPYLVMELVDGPTVATLLAGGPLPIADVLTVGSQVSDGLAAAHAAGIIHRDIKPSNLIVTPGGVVKICDFGVARLLDPSASANLTGPATAWGSPHYMAPEQISGGPLDRRADLYALGCTMYAMLTGTPPFTADGPFGVLHQHITQPPESVRLRRPEVPLQVEALVADLLAKRPDERPFDARVVRERIVTARADPAVAAARSVQLRSAAPPVGAAPAAQATLPVTEEPPAGLKTGSGTPTTKRRRWAITAVAAAAITVAGAAIVLAMLRTETGPVARVWTGPSASPVTSPAPAAVASPTLARSTGTAPPDTPPRSRTAHSATTTRPPTRADPITGLRQAIGQQVTAGSLKADTANDLYHMVNDLAKTIATGNTDEVANKIKALRAKLTTLNREGKLSDDGYRVLNTAVNQVAADQS